MANEQDEVSATIGGALDKVAGTGNLSVGVKSRFVAAVDRMTGSIFDWGATWIDTKADRLKHEEKLRQEFREFQLAELKHHLKQGDATLLKRVKLGSDYSTFDRFLNYKAVVEEAAEMLASEPLSTPENDGSTETIDEDWMARFRLSAEAAASDDLRGLWARILAGESRQPGSFSASALRFVSEVDKKLAECCERVSQEGCMGAIVKREEFNSGAFFADALTLQSHGLLTGVDGNIFKKYQFPDNGELILHENGVGLKLTGTPGHSFQVDATVITELGQEVFSLLKLPKSEENFRFLATQLQPNATKIELIRTHQFNPQAVGIIGTEVIYLQNASAPPSS